AAAPALVAYAEVWQLPRFFPAVCTPQVCQWRVCGRSNIFYPLHHLLYCAAANIAADIGFCTEHLDEVEKLMSAEVIVFDHPSPMGVDHWLSLRARANTVLPVILVCEAA